MLVLRQNNALTYLSAFQLNQVHLTGTVNGEVRIFLFLNNLHQIKAQNNKTAVNVAFCAEIKKDGLASLRVDVDHRSQGCQMKNYLFTKCRFKSYEISPDFAFTSR